MFFSFNFCSALFPTVAFIACSLYRNFISYPQVEVQSMSQKLTKLEVDLDVTSVLSESMSHHHEYSGSPRLDLSFRRGQEREDTLKQEVLAANRKYSALEYELKGTRERLEEMKLKIRTHEEKEHIFRDENAISQVNRT